MIFALERTVEPATEPVSLVEMRRHLRCYDDLTDDNSDISALITAAREWAEEYTGRALVDQTWRLTITQDDRRIITAPADPSCVCGQFDWEQVNEVLLRKSPVLAVSSVVTVDTSGATTTIDSSDYSLREQMGKFPRLVGAPGISWASAHELRITFRAGYVDNTDSPTDGTNDVPRRFVTAMKLWAEAHYDRGENMQDLIRAATSLIKPERVNISFA